MEDLTRLKAWLAAEEHIAIAFSGGVDSSFLLQVALDTLGRDQVLALMVVSAALPIRERLDGRSFLDRTGARHQLILEDVARIPGFDTNPSNRCYLCKRHLFGRLVFMAREQGFVMLADGTNADDLRDYRPGLKALVELGVASPLAQFGFTKPAIRSLSRKMGIPGWDRPPLACLATRFPMGETITADRLARVDAVEEAIRGFGFAQCRVRCHPSQTRIELDAEGLAKVAEPGCWAAILNAAEQQGFKSVVLDPAGYRMGSMNSGDA